MCTAEENYDDYDDEAEGGDEEETENEGRVDRVSQRGVSVAQRGAAWVAWAVWLALGDA